MENMNWDVREEGSWVILSISGRLDRMNADETGRQGETLLAENSKLALDLTGLEYISSAGLRAMFRLIKQAKAVKKSFALCGVRGFVQDMLKDSNMDILVDIYATTEQLP